MEAYLDSLLYRTAGTGWRYDLIVTADCDLPVWLTDTNRLSVTRYNIPSASGIGLTRVTAEVVRRYLREHNPDRVRQITQPRWHAPGVLIGSLGAGVETCTRAAASLFAEYSEAPMPVRAWLANNIVGRSVFLANRLYTPKYGGLGQPWWAPTELVVEERVVNRDRFSRDAEPRTGLFERDKHRVLTVGRVSRRKGTDLLLPVADHLSNCEFVVVGPIEDEDLAMKISAAANITRHPPVDYVEMPGLYSAADLLLSASRLEWGGVSRAMLEAKATGQPVVALDRAQAAAVADSVTPADPEAIAMAIKRHLGAG